MICVAILTWLESCWNELAFTACHPRASSRFIANLNKKRLQRKRQTTPNQWLVALIAKSIPKTTGEEKSHFLGFTAL